ncbi:hypothetical protein [Orenia marismortui]|uniref:hypothetical protein n=1 Tax=Orenia marismortui TaxID=46469 RepID=UPI00037A245B|nr:hypothetical protein [Orenia marismortui]
MQLNSDYKPKIFENKLVILFIVVIMFLSSSTLLTYKILSFKNTLEVRRFERKVNNILKAYKAKNDNSAESKVDKNEVVKLMSSNVEDRLKNRKYSTKDPFQVVLKKASKNIGKNRKKGKISGTENITDNIKVLGVVNNGPSKVAIVKFGTSNSAVQIMKIGESFAGCTLKEIRYDGIVIERHGEYFVYIFGGESN